MTKGAWLALAIALFVVEICAIQVFSARVCIGGFDPTSARAHWSSRALGILALVGFVTAWRSRRHNLGLAARVVVGLIVLTAIWMLGYVAVSKAMPEFCS